MTSLQAEVLTPSGHSMADLLLAQLTTAAWLRLAAVAYASGSGQLQ